MYDLIIPRFGGTNLRRRISLCQTRVAGLPLTASARQINCSRLQFYLADYKVVINTLRFANIIIYHCIW